MNNWIAWCLLAVLALIMAWYYKHSKKPVKSALIGTVSGVAAAALAWTFQIGSFTLSYFSIGVAAVLGVPGVVTTMVLNQLFG